MQESKAMFSFGPRLACAAGVLALALFAGADAFAQGGRVGTPRHAAAQAAGIRALHLCSGYFGTGSDRAFVDSIAATNAHQIAPPTARTEVDEQGQTVSVYFDESMPPRIAAARPVVGCTLLPVGAQKDLAGLLPRPAAVSKPNLDDRAWPTGDRNAQGRLPRQKKAAVDKIIDEAFKDEAGAYQGVTWGVLVIKDGKIVAERYQHGFSAHQPARTNSMCKSLGGTLVGVGVQKGLLDVRRKAPLSEWRTPGDPRGQITLDDLMHMGSGLYSESGGDRQLDIYASGAPVSEAAALAVVETPPGKRFVYSGSDNLLAVRALRQAVNDDEAYLTFPYRELLWKIGMTRTVVETDWRGDFLTSGQCWSTARDFGRFGLLYLADGVWGGERLLPAGWSRYAATPAPAQPDPGGIGGDARYGAQFWLYGGLDGLAPDAFAAFGARGQYAMIIPSQRVVVVRRGFDRQAGFKIAKFSADVAAALAD